MRQNLFFKSCLFLLFVSTSVAFVWAGELRQQRTITGTVRDSTDILSGVSVSIKGRLVGTSTDGNGKYILDIPSETSALVFSMVGYLSVEIEVGNRSVIDVVLEPDMSMLEETVVVAFGRQRKEAVVGSVTSVTPSELKIPSSNLTTSLAGRVAGLIAYQRSGEPGLDNAEFFIRGVTTFGYKKDPLILIDNNEVTTVELARLQPDDIASFSIMKDATATSLYGSRGANGVILIATKQGIEGSVKINVRLEESLSAPTSLVKLADPITYMQLHNEAVRTRDPLGRTLYSRQKIDNTVAGGNPYVYPANDWYDILLRDNTMNHRLNFNMSGGGKVARYYLAGSVIRDNGILKVDKINNFNNNVRLNRSTLRSNVDISVSKTTEATVRLNGAFDDYTGPIDGGTELFRKIMRTNPVLFPPYYQPDEANLHTQHVLFGNYDEGGFNNPYADMVKGYKDYTTSQMSAQFELRQQFDFITEGLSMRAMLNTSRYAFFDVARFYNPFYYQVALYDKATDQYMLNVLNEEMGTEYLEYQEGKKDINSTTYFESSINWDRVFHAKHALSALMVYTMRNQLFANAGDLQKSLPYRNVGLAGRATYAFDNRYFTEFNFGYNGSERFHRSERFGFFPSIGLGWTVSNEAFWTDRLADVVNRLKFRATYGLVGNDAIGDENDRFYYLSNVNMTNTAMSSSFGTYGNAGGRTLNGVSISRYPNTNITWEKSLKLNLGVELGLWNKVDIQADVFTENRTNILMNRASIPTTMGLQAVVRANVGEAYSKGVDISANYNHSFHSGFWINGMANFTYATSEFSVYEEPDYVDSPWKYHVGYSLNQRWGYVAERLFVDDEEVRNSPVQFGDYRGGDIKYKDINEDGIISELDMVPMGFPTSPEIVYGFGLSGGWKRFDMSFFFQGLARESFWIDALGTAPFIDNENALLKAYADNHWSETNRNIFALWPRLSSTVNTNNTQVSNWFMRDGAFLRLKSVELGYNLPEKALERVKVKNLRVYFNGTNLLTFSKFKLWDPEMGGDGLGYPIQKVFNVGALISF